MIRDRLHELQRQHRELTTKRVERRIARALLRLPDEAGRHVEAGLEIGFPLSGRDLAPMTGTTLFTVSRTLTAWLSERILATGRCRIAMRQLKCPCGNR